uniref:Uncharacterized protein n=1 Tax=Avena sativa TaxID=4498 RepID=A0ACD5X946_AVESA
MGDATIPNGGRLASILLARKPRFTACTNDTTATAKSKDGNTIAVSFWVAEPPQLSLFSIHCTKGTEKCFFSVMPRVVGADGPFVLLRAAFASSREFFLYKAGSPPSLERIPSPHDGFGDFDDMRRVTKFGILGLEGGHYLLATLHDAPSLDDGYQLRIYSSKIKSWSTRTLHNPCPGVDRVIPDKVITLGQGGLMGWVDLSHGLLVCDLLLLQDPHTTGGGGVSFFIPLPEPLPGNRYKLKHPIPPTKKAKGHPAEDKESHSASWFRDLTCVNGVLKFVEMENPPPESKEDNIIYDADLIMSLKRKAVDGNPKQQLSSFRDAWRVVTWSREVSSSWSNFWRQTCAAHVSDIKSHEVTFRDLYSAFPILSPEDGDDILYLKSLVEISHWDGWVAAVDIGNKALKATGQYYLPDDFYYDRCYDVEHPFLACTLSHHMDMTPGIQVSACRKITEASSSASLPSNTSIRVGEPSSCEPRTTIQGLIELSEKIKRAKNAGESIIQNDHISQVHPVENNLPQKQCFNKWDVPCYAPGLSLRHHQNNLAMQQCFNKPNGPCGPGYASLAPVHGRHNYQPMWPSSKQQLTSSSEFGPHEAPQPCFNYRNGASYYGYSQQLAAPNSFSYGAHTGYGNFQPQWLQLTPILELPIGASWQPPPPGVQRQKTPREVKTSCGMLTWSSFR